MEEFKRYEYFCKALQLYVVVYRYRWGGLASHLYVIIKKNIEPIVTILQIFP